MEKKKRPASGLFKLLGEVWRLLETSRRSIIVAAFLMIVGRCLGLALPAAARFLIDDVIGKHRQDLLPVLLAIIVGVGLLQGVSSFWTTKLLAKASLTLIADLRCRVQAHVIRLPISFHDKSQTGALVSRIMNDLEGLRALAGPTLVQLPGAAISAALAIAGLFYISAKMTGVALVLLGLFTLLTKLGMGRMRPLFLERSRINAEVSGRLTESMGGVRVIKGYCAEEFDSRVFAEGSQRILKNGLRALTVTSLMTSAISVFTAIAASAVLYVGAKQIFAGTLTAGGLTAYCAFLMLLVAPVMQTVSLGTQVSEAGAGLERAHELLSTPREADDPRRTELLENLEGRVEFEDVVFSYEPGKVALHKVNFRAEPGMITALVGSSGAGKSTAISLISAFYTPDAGRVTVDGKDLATIDLASYRRHVGLVLQETFLFEGSIRENVAFSRPSASWAEIKKACEIARVDEFAERLPEAYNTIVGERGVRLSGGQRQRISIARAILAEPRILILDEATSSLDSESEVLIQEALVSVMEGRTTFVIAHRLSTIRRADQILVLERGLIIERGTHDKLYAAGGRYFDLITRQQIITNRASDELMMRAEAASVN